MLQPHPEVLRELVAEYEALAAPGADPSADGDVGGDVGRSAATDADTGAHDGKRRLADVEYTLCVSMGTRDAKSALAAARRVLAEQR